MSEQEEKPLSGEKVVKEWKPLKKPVEGKDSIKSKINPLPENPVTGFTPLEIPTGVNNDPEWLSREIPDEEPEEKK